MKVIIAGSRDLKDYGAVERAVVASGFEITEVVSGGATGADALGERWASENGVPVRKFPADWNAHGKAAGPIRNGLMAEYADALIALPRGESRGTKDMIRKARAAGLAVYVDDGKERLRLW